METSIKPSRKLPINPNEQMASRISERFGENYAEEWRVWREIFRQRRQERWNRFREDRKKRRGQEQTPIIKNTTRSKSAAIQSAEVSNQGSISQGSISQGSISQGSISQVGETWLLVTKEDAIEEWQWIETEVGNLTINDDGGGGNRN